MATETIGITDMDAVREAVKVSLFTPGDRGWGCPVLFWGEPGVGKTSVIEQEAAKYGMNFQVFSPGEMGEAAFGVVPVPVTLDGEMFLRFPAPEFAIGLGDKPGVIFIDEIVCAPRACKPGLLALLYEKRIGGFFFGKNIRVISAANPPDIASNGSQLSIPEANRVCHVKWPSVSEDAWYEHMLSDGKELAVEHDATELEAMVVEKWPSHFSTAAAMAYAFMRNRKGQKILQKLPEATSKNRVGAWPSSRSWTMATRLLAGSNLHQVSTGVRDDLICGAIGSGMGGEFIQFFSTLDIPDTEKLLRGEVKWEWDEKRPDVGMVVAFSCLSLLGQWKEQKNAAFAPAINRFGNILDGYTSKEIVILSLQQMLNAPPTRKIRLSDSSKLSDIVKKHEKVLSKIFKMTATS